MIKQILAATVLASSVLGAFADNHDTMYLIKGSQVVGKYNVTDVDYVSFTLPEGVDDSNISTEIKSIGKNTVTYTISTVNPNIAYAHNILTHYDVNYTALDLMGESFDSLEDEAKQLILKYTLQYNAYIGIGTQTYTQQDFQLDGTGPNSRFKVIPGTHYYLCTWEVDPANEYAPLDNFKFKEFDTLAPEESSATFNCVYKETSEYGAIFDFSGNDICYITTCWGPLSTMELFVNTYGLDYVLGTFGQFWELDFLQDSGDLGEGIPNSIWPIDRSGKYVMYARAFDFEGNCKDIRLELDIQVVSSNEGPSINIFSKQKSNGSVSVNFEITPSNVEEAYVRLCGENFVDDRLNMGYELHEIATGGDAEDITSIINSLGEYTYTNNEVEEEWKALLIYAMDKDGNRTTLRINFFPDDETQWDIYNPVFKTPAKKLPAIKHITGKRNPSIRR